MSWELYIAFMAAAAVVLVIPGPTVLLVVGYALSGGWRYAMAAVAGVALGDATAVTLSLVGLGAALMTSASLFAGLKWLGAGYLIWLGICSWRATPAAAVPDAEQPVSTPWTRLCHAWLVTALNPKGIIFHVAFLPQFVSPIQPVAPQLVILAATFVVLAFINATLYALAADSARRRASDPRVIKVISRAGGAALVGAGLMTAALKR